MPWENEGAVIWCNILAENCSMVKATEEFYRCDEYY